MSPQLSTELRRTIEPHEREIVYCRFLRALLDRDDFPTIKANIGERLRCTHSVLDGIHAQLTKDVNSAAEQANATEYGDSKSALRLAVRSARMRAIEDDLETPMLDGLADLLKLFGETARARGADLVWSEYVPSRFLDEHENLRAAGSYESIVDTNFDFPAKKLWRAEWELFLIEKLRDVPMERRGTMTLLCLSSANPTLELSLYKRLGFAASNVITVEKIDAVAEKLRANLEKLGGWYSDVRVVRQDLLRFLKQSTATFDIVSLDFHGCFGFDKLEIMENLRFRDRGLILINLEKGREKPGAQKLLVDLLHDREIIVQKNDSFASVGAQLFGDLKPVRVPLDSVREYRDEMRQARGDLMDQQLIGCLEMATASGSRYVRSEADQFRSLWEELIRRNPGASSSGGAFDYALDTYLYSLGDSIAHVMQRPGVQEKMNENGLGHISCVENERSTWIDHAGRAMHNRITLWDFRRFSYRSAASSNNQEYLSTFAEVRRFDYGQNAGIRFFAESLVIALKRALDNAPGLSGFVSRPHCWGPDAAYDMVRRAIMSGGVVGWGRIKNDIGRKVKASNGEMDTVHWVIRDGWNKERLLDSPKIAAFDLMTCGNEAAKLRNGSPLVDKEYMKCSNTRRILAA